MLLKKQLEKPRLKLMPKQRLLKLLKMLSMQDFNKNSKRLKLLRKPKKMLLKLSMMQ